MTGRSRFFIFAALVAALLMTGLAAWAAVGVTWQGQKALLPTTVYGAAVAGYNGKIYVAAGGHYDSGGNLVAFKGMQIYNIAADTWSSGADAPTARYYAAGAELGGKIYVMGGRDLSGPTNKVEVYDPVANSWASAAALPASIRGEGAAAYNGKIYVAGGNGDTPVNTTYIYDPTANTWSTGAVMPSAAAYGALAAVGDKLYWIGGIVNYPTAGASDYVGKAFIYDPVANTWDPAGIPMFEVVGFTPTIGVDEAHGKIYVFGGESWSDDYNADVPDPYCQVLDTATKTFSQISFMPTPISRDEANVGSDGGKIYIIGGGHSPFYGTTYTLVDVYDPVADSYYLPNASVPNGGASSCVAGAVGGKIYSLHGVAAAADGLVDVYDIAGNAWTTSTHANPKPTYGGTGGATPDKVVISGGLDAGNAIVGTTSLYDPVADSWSSLLDDTTKRFWGAGCVLDGKLYVFGGAKDTKHTPVADLNVLDIAANTWTKKKVLPAAMLGLTAVPYGGKIYLFGGAKVYPPKKSSDIGGTLVYDPVADTYDTSKAVMPSPAAFAAAAGYGDFIFVQGGMGYVKLSGSSGFGELNGLQIYDAKNNAWISADGLFSRTGHSMVSSGGKLYIFNGDDTIFVGSGGGGSVPADRLCIALITGVGPTQLSATASGSPTTGAAPLHVVFTGGASGGTVPYTYAWTFGDTGTSADQNPTHDYTANGDYTATLTVTDSATPPATAPATVAIHVGGAAFTVAVTADKISGPAPLDVTFTATPSGGTEPYTYAWDFKDSGTSTDKDPAHTFAADGTYNVALTVTDHASNTATGNITITVVSITPPAVTAMKKSGNPFRFTVTGSNLQNHVKVYIGTDTTEWSPVVWKSTTKVLLKGGKALKTKVPKGTPMDFKFVNPDTGSYTFHWAGW